MLSGSFSLSPPALVLYSFRMVASHRGDDLNALLLALPETPVNRAYLEMIRDHEATKLKGTD